MKQKIIILLICIITTSSFSIRCDFKDEDENDSNITCEYNGAIYNVGDSFTCEDGCNTCWCVEDGSIGATLKECEDIYHIEWPPNDYSSDEYSIDECDITDDDLQLKITYSGGCEDHEFDLLISPSFLESLPVQVSTLLMHNANNDSCDTLISEVISFDLNSLKERYKQCYFTESGTIIINGLCGNGFSNGIYYNF